MSKQSQLNTNNETNLSLTHAFILSTVILIIVCLLDMIGAWTPVNRTMYDALLRVRISVAPLPLSPRILPVDLNDRAERNLGDRIENRMAFVDLFTVLGEGELTGGMDFLFAGSKDPIIDSQMAEAASNMESLVLAIVPLNKEASNFSGNPLSSEDESILERNLWHPIIKSAGRIPSAESFLIPNHLLTQNSKYLGHIGVTPDADGIYRRTPLFYRWKDGYMPSLALALTAAQYSIDTSRIIINAGHYVSIPLSQNDTVKIPIDMSGMAWIPYPSTWMSGWKRIPMDTIANSVNDDSAMSDMIDALSGSLIVVADTTTAKKDFGTTPFETIYPLSGIHTSILNGIINNIFYHDISIPLKLCFLVLFIGIVLFALTRRNDTLFHSIFIVSLVIFFGIEILIWFMFNIVPWIAIISIYITLSWICGFVYRLLRSHEKKILLESALTRYFPRALASRVMTEGKVDLKPSKKDLTILFADIAGFTKWSSDKSPEDVHAFLSDYLESMATILFEYGGTVDKFMGDGILAFFGDPFEQPDHIYRCLHAALAMQLKVKELRNKWKPILGIDLKIRIGINTGKVIVGNLGSKTRIEYTVIGASVNLAQRMESNAPVEGILVTQDTWDYARKQFRFSEMREVIVKGYDEVIHAYVLEGEND